MDAEQRQADTVAGKMGYARKRDGDKMGFDFKAGTWQKAATSKVRNAQERLRRLEASPVDRPPVQLRLNADLAVEADNRRRPAWRRWMEPTQRSCSARGVQRSGPPAPHGFRSLDRRQRSSSPVPTAPASPRCFPYWPAPWSRPGGA